MGLGAQPGCQCLGDCKAESPHEPVVLDFSATTADGFEALRENYPYGEGFPENCTWWLPAAAHGLCAEEIAQAADAWALCADDLRRRTSLFVNKAQGGVPCRLIEPRTGLAKPARYNLVPSTASFGVELVGPSGGSAARREFRICDVQNIWVCSDSELACRALGANFHQGSADAELACVLLIDVPEGPIAVVERSAEAREDFLDCMAVLIAAQRAKDVPDVALCGLPGRLPPPEARLRPNGRSLQSVHLSGPICLWLARAGEGLLSGEALEAL